MISISIFSIEDDMTTLYVVGLRITLTSVLLFLLFHLNLILSQKQLRPRGRSGLGEEIVAARVISSATGAC